MSINKQERVKQKLSSFLIQGKYKKGERERGKERKNYVTSEFLYPI